ncbi:uncharacterized protein LOC119376525 [Rhipicephalus sanguineus]|uniref:uncharacterized protein LOC119376525 n=1 Tax=Rhipicephalus sanguineus TaxID=34632 RepID=UPI001893FF45|nr:uncharacterized protein LOC119376525 [Rhipicephalus sanguineus]
MQCISEDIQRWGTDSEVLILGDFNGHIQEIDGFLDFNGDLMQQCTRRRNLNVANLRPDCEGEFTWCARNSRTCIDCVLVSSRLACQVKHISIDEEGDFSIGSDHNRIRLTICSSTWCKKEREHRKPGQRFLPEAAYEDIAKEFDSNLQTSKPLKYEEYMEELQRLMRQYEVRTNSRGGVRRKGWWDEEVRKALDERKAANRLHRKAVKTLSASDALQAWQEYLTCKQAMQTIVQSKIAEHNSRQLQSFTADGRNGARKFWTYVSSLDGKAKVPQIRHEDTGQPVSDMGRHLADHMRKLYDVGSGEPEIDSIEYHPINEYRLRNNVKWEVTRPALDRAIARIGAHTARGLDGIPAGLIKCFGEEARQKLADIFSGIMTGEPIPEDWLCGRVILVPKRGGDAGLLREYRPLTVTSVLYRTFAQILKTWMSGWAEHDDKLTELQNGFRIRRRLEVNVFVLTQAIEIARKENRGLYTCFLNVAKAYDSVPHDPLFHCMTQIGMPKTWVSLLRRLLRALPKLKLNQ